MVLSAVYFLLLWGLIIAEHQILSSCLQLLGKIRVNAAVLSEKFGAQDYLLYVGWVQKHGIFFSIMTLILEF